MSTSTRSRNVPITMLRSVIAPCILFAAAAPSFAVVNGSFVVNPDNSVTYSYEVDNTGGVFDISGWALDFGFALPDWNQADAPIGDVIVPNLDWIAGPAAPLTGLSAQDFLSLGPTGDVLINTTLTGFSFTSAFLPGEITYHEFSADGKSTAGRTIGPVFAALSVPDSGNRFIEAMAVVSLAALGATRQRRRRHSSVA